MYEKPNCNQYFGLTDDTKWLPSTSHQAVSMSEDASMTASEDSLTHAVTIDQSLTKLFQCMTLAYR